MLWKRVNTSKTQCFLTSPFSLFLVYLLLYQHNDIPKKYTFVLISSISLECSPPSTTLKRQSDSSRRRFSHRRPFLLAQQHTHTPGVAFQHIPRCWFSQPTLPIPQHSLCSFYLSFHSARLPLKAVIVPSPLPPLLATTPMLHYPFIPIPTSTGPFSAPHQKHKERKKKRES